MISSLRLEQFRAWEERSFTFSPNTTVITGSNGTGKTTILEAISMLSLTTSWRTEKDTEVVRWGTPFARVVGDEKELVIQVNPYLKRIRIDGVSKRAIQVIGYFPTVLFQPDDIFLLYGAPSLRRNYLDRVISQISSTYTRAILQLGKILKQRNRLLKHIQEGMAGEAELAFWDTELAAVHEISQGERMEFITFLNTTVPAMFQEMVPESPSIAIRYHQSPHGHTHSFLEHLILNRTKEIGASSSLYGPHREDFEVFWGEHPVQTSMSRGQARALIVAFKIAELQYLTAKNQTRPVLLLDDIFSELDEERRERLVGVFGGYQTIITTTEIGHLGRVVGTDSYLIEV